MNNKKRVTKSFRMTEDCYEKLKSLSVKNNRNISMQLELLIENGLPKEK